MFVIWTGWGWTVAMIWALTGVYIQSCAEAQWDYPMVALAIVLAGSLLASGLIWSLAKVLREKFNRTMVDAKTGKTVILDYAGSLYGVPMRFWVYIVPVLNMGLALYGLYQ